MYTVEMLEQATAVARELGYKIRHEWLGGSGGGACEFNGRKWIFVDLALSVTDQLDQVVGALRSDPAIHLAALSRDMKRLLDLQRAA